MSDTPHLALPYLAANQSQKHVSHNEALRLLDAVVQLSVLDRDLAEPPPAPVEGDRYLVAATATGAWSGRDNEIAAWIDGTWMFLVPQAGWLAHVADEAVLTWFDGGAWRGIGDAMALTELGINATADAVNRLAVGAEAVLFNHDGGSSQVKVNKAAPVNTASHLFQTGFSGRAEFGLAGDDDFHAKVSPDGANWYEGLTIDSASGVVDFPAGLKIAGGSLLDTLAEGAWTPTAAFGTNGDFTPTYTRQEGHYLALGNLVFIEFDLQFSTNAFSTACGSFVIDGLPFARVTHAIHAGPALTRLQNVAFGGYVPSLTFWGNGTQIYLAGATAGAAGIIFGTAQLPASTADIRIAGSGQFWRA